MSGDKRSNPIPEHSSGMRQSKSRDVSYASYLGMEMSGEERFDLSSMSPLLSGRH